MARQRTLAVSSGVDNKKRKAESGQGLGRFLHLSGGADSPIGEYPAYAEASAGKAGTLEKKRKRHLL